MNNLTEKKLRTNKNRIHQTDAREFKQELHKLFKAQFESMGLLVTEIENALVLEIPNDELGAIPIEAKFVVKNLDFDILAAEHQHLQKIEAAKVRKETK